MKTLRLWPTLLFLLLIQVACRAQSISAPPLKAGQFVYTVPSNFDPPLIGRDGLDDIQREAQKLHHPFYAVIVESFDGQSDQDASDAVDGIVAQWSKDRRFDPGTASVFLLSYSPRKFRLLAGSTWRAKIGLDGQAGVQPYLDIFTNYIHGSAKDPKTGIIETMKALDAFVFDQTDPARIAAREAAAQRAAAQRRQEAARRQREQAASLLDDQINRMGVLLGSTQFLPSNTAPYREALERAKTIRNSNHPEQFTSAAATLRNAANRLQGEIDAKKNAAAAAAARQEQAQQAALKAQQDEANRRSREAVTKWGLVLGCLALLLGSIWARYGKWRGLSRQLREEIGSWDTSLLNAANNYLRFFEERKSTTELANTTGKTKAVYDEVTSEAGTLYPTILAMKDRVEQAKTGLQAGSFWNLRPLHEARALLVAEFDFNTDEVRRGLFDSPTRTIKVQPEELRRQLAQQYAENIAQWDELMEALRLRGIVAQEAFPPTHLTQMLQLADQKGIPHQWLSPHPLFGDDASDQSFYARLNELRPDDPLAYKERLDAAQQVERNLDGLLGRIVRSLDTVAEKKLVVLPPYGPTVVAPDDDPAITLAAAQRAEADLAGLIAAKKNIGEIEAEAQSAIAGYEKCLQQVAVISAAIAGSRNDLQAALSLAAATQTLETQTEHRLQQAATVHRDTRTPAGSLQSGQAYMTQAAHLITQAQHQLGENRHLEARGSAQAAARQLNMAQQGLNQCLAQCDQLDEQKRQYEQQMANLEAARENAESRLRRYGRNVRLNPYNFSDYGPGPLDYALMLAQMNAYQQSMEAQVRTARLAYEAEVARAEREREIERQRSHSSSSSWDSGSSFSSGSSWSGGGSGSSSGGGSWSGGGSSSSSGGGSW